MLYVYVHSPLRPGCFLYQQFLDVQVLIKVCINSCVLTDRGFLFSLCVCVCVCVCAIVLFGIAVFQLLFVCKIVCFLSDMFKRGLHLVLGVLPSYE